MVNFEHVPEGESKFGHARILRPAEELGFALKKFPERCGILGYYDADQIVWKVDGYDFVYLDDQKNLCHLRLVPDEIPELASVEPLHEREAAEKLLRSSGYHLIKSEEFRTAVYNELRRK